MLKAGAAAGGERKYTERQQRQGRSAIAHKGHPDRRSRELYLFKRQDFVRVDAHDNVLDGPVDGAEDVADAGGDDDDIAGADAPAFAAAQFVAAQAGPRWGRRNRESSPICRRR